MQSFASQNTLIPHHQPPNEANFDKTKPTQIQPNFFRNSLSINDTNAAFLSIIIGFVWQNYMYGRTPLFILSQVEGLTPSLPVVNLSKRRTVEPSKSSPCRVVSVFAKSPLPSGGEDQGEGVVKHLCRVVITAHLPSFPPPERRKLLLPPISHFPLTIFRLCQRPKYNRIDFTLSYAYCPALSDSRSKKENAVGAEAESSIRKHVVSQLATDSDDAHPFRLSASGVAPSPCLPCEEFPPSEP